MKALVYSLFLVMLPSLAYASPCSGIARTNSSPCTTLVDGYNGTTTGNYSIGNYTWMGQNFLCSSNYTVCKCVARMARRTELASARVTCAIYTDNSGQPGERIGNFSTEVLQTEMGATEQDVTFSGLDAPLESGLTYWLVIYQTSYITGSYYFYWYSQTGPEGVKSMISSSGNVWLDGNTGYAQKFLLYR